jgi:dihydrofolate reductase
MVYRNIAIIVAVAQNFAIGKNNELLFHLSNDLKRFKKITKGHSVIMGKKTFFSLPNGPLPHRRNIVITDIPGERFDGCETVNSIEEVIGLVIRTAKKPPSRFSPLATSLERNPSLRFPDCACTQRLQSTRARRS